MPKQLVKPPEEILLAVVTDAVQPEIANLEQQFGSPLAVKVTLWRENYDDWSMDVPNKTAAEGERVGEIRISFRETFVPLRWLFFAEAVFSHEIFPGTGFSGFSLNGDVKRENGVRKVRIRGLVYRYNVFQFRGWH